jgi:flagellar biosynthesis/type III secretory pathway chaperone
MTDTTASIDWEAAIAELLTELSTVQDELLGVLSAKRTLMAAGDVQGLAEQQSSEEQLGRRLAACHARRGELLRQAAASGLSGDSIGQLAAHLPHADKQEIGSRVQQAAARMQLLRHHSLTNWVLAQRSLLHLAQLLEILATGGQTKPTYSLEEGAPCRGSLVDQAA